MSSAVSSSARGAGFLILLQFSTRILTFVLNQILLRFLSPSLMGASVQLELFIISAHHFARESLRVACERKPKDGIQAAINLSYLSLLGGVPIVFGLGEWYLRAGVPDVPYFKEALRLCQLAAIIELLSEPAYVAGQQKMLYKTRAAAEATAVVAKTVVTAGAIFWSQHRGIDLGMLPFAAGELAFCPALTLVYLWQTVPVAKADGFSLLPQKMGDVSKNRKKSDSSSDFVLSLFSKSLLNLSFSLYIQSGIKYVLTQGDVLVSSTLATLEDQGMYALAANYGGLIARMICRPIEDSARNLFAQLCAPASTSTMDRKQDKSTSDPPKITEKSTSNIPQAAQTLTLILRIYTLISLPTLTLGPTAAPLLLNLIAGSRWSSTGAGQVLGTYCYSIPLLAINGVSEAFVAATANTTELHWQSVWMAGFSAAFAGSAWLFLKVWELGGEGLVWANCVNMGLRIVFNLWFARGFFNRNGVEFKISDLLPNVYAMGVTVVVPSSLARTDGMLEERYGVLGELARVGGIGVVFVGVLAVTERKFLLDCWGRFRS